MRIAVLGTGMVGRAVTVGLARLGHDVVVGSREPSEAPARLDLVDAFVGSADHGRVSVGTYAEASLDADMVVNALHGRGSVAGIFSAEIAEGTVVLDVANPLDFTGELPTLFVGNDDSLGEQLQREFPSLRVVKSLNTMTAEAMVDPTLVNGGDFTTFVSGNDDAAKAQVCRC